jgi:hypothetical protein
MGTGRSGSTLLGAVIASCSAADAIHVGELNWYYNYLGLKPHIRTDWENEVQGFYESLEINCTKKTDLTREEKYRACLFHLLGVLRKPSKEYCAKTKVLIDSVFEKSGASILVDSSKYPLRAVWLRLLYEEKVAVVRIRRKAESYYQTVSKTNPYQPSQSLWFAWIYFNVVNILTYLIYKKFKGKKSEVFLEDLQQDYVRNTKRIFMDLGVNNKKNINIESGYVFEGNRMAKSREIILRSSSSDVKYKTKYKLLGFFSWRK